MPSSFDDFEPPRGCRRFNSKQSSIRKLRTVVNTRIFGHVRLLIFLRSPLLNIHHRYPRLKTINGITAVKLKISHAFSHVYVVIEIQRATELLILRIEIKLSARVGGCQKACLWPHLQCWRTAGLVSCRLKQGVGGWGKSGNTSTASRIRR